jgi:hypothetical protein
MTASRESPFRSRVAWSRRRESNSLGSLTRGRAIPWAAAWWRGSESNGMPEGTHPVATGPGPTTCLLARVEAGGRVERLSRRTHRVQTGCRTTPASPAMCSVLRAGLAVTPAKTPTTRRELSSGRSAGELPAVSWAEPECAAATSQQRHTRGRPCACCRYGTK